MISSFFAILSNKIRKTYDAPLKVDAKGLKILVFVHFVILISSSLSAQYITERPEWAGVWFNTWNNIPDFSGLEDILAGEAGREKWENYEPQKGVYDFSDLKTKLQRAADGNYYFYFSLWTGPSSPDWIYTNGVPRVSTDNGSFPFYLDKDYKAYATSFFDTLAATLASYDPELTQSLAFIQPMQGIKRLHGVFPTPLLLWIIQRDM